MKSKDVHQLCWTVCHHCQVFQTVKPRRGQVPWTMDFFPIPDEIFSSLCMDFVDIEPCKDNEDKSYDCCFVIVCRLSGYIMAIPCRKEGLTTKTVEQLFLDKCVSFMGLTNEIVSDNDHLISSRFTTHYVDLWELKNISQSSTDQNQTAGLRQLWRLLSQCWWLAYKKHDQTG